MTIRIVVGSTRPVRAGDQIAAEISALLHAHAPERTFEVIDLRELDLPMLDEPQMAALGDYRHEHTREWARIVEGAEALIFVLPQYNFGYPASAKNAVDYLYREWIGKPVGIVSYGGHGGLQSADQFAQVLTFVGAHLTPTSVGLALAREAYGADGRLVDARAAVAPVQGALACLLDDLANLIESEQQPPGVASLVAVTEGPRARVQAFLDAVTSADAQRLGESLEPGAVIVGLDGSRLDSLASIVRSFTPSPAGTTMLVQRESAAAHTRMLTTSVAVIEQEVELRDGQDVDPSLQHALLSLTLVRQPGTQHWLITAGALIRLAATSLAPQMETAHA